MDNDDFKFEVTIPVNRIGDPHKLNEALEAIAHDKGAKVKTAVRLLKNSILQPHLSMRPY
jgi:hypothetical protein